jgi:hypothetical protein
MAMVFARNALGEPNVTIVYPNEGATWEKGQTYRLDYYTQGCVGLKLNFSLVHYGDIYYFNTWPGDLITYDGSHSFYFKIPSDMLVNKYYISLLSKIDQNSIFVD